MAARSQEELRVLSDPMPGGAPGSSSDLGLDLNDCDREPIHIPGAIQPHGLVLVAQAEGLKIVGGAGDLEGRLAPDWLDRTLGDLLGAETVAPLEAAGEAASVVLGAVKAREGALDVVAHRAGDRVIVELEPANPRALAGTEVLAVLEAAAAGFERAAHLAELCQRAAAAFRRMTGYDRVMVYRFLDDDAGVVVAEDKAAGESSFLNHHFPATDIPRQARALYVRNRVRVIPDVAYDPVPLRGGDPALATLDLSDVALRSVSPIHIQYLKNMGVAASASVSIVKDGVLWGLIACHHPTPKGLTFDARMACRALAGGLARQVRAKEDAELYRERIRLRASEDVVLTRLGGDLSLADFFEVVAGDLQRMLGADGFAAVQGKDLFAGGRRPSDQHVRALADWIGPRAYGQAYHTASLSRAWEPARAFADVGSGLLAVTMSTDEPTILMWFRAEHVQVVEWAGNPHKAVTGGGGGPLSPRASFDAWSEEVRGRARPFTLVEIEAASRLRRNLFEARQNRRLRQLNRELAATVADNQALLTQKDYLIKEVNHRVQNSLQLVSAFLAIQARNADDEAVSGHLSEAQNRLQAVALVHRRLYADDNVENVDLARYLEELVAELKASMGEEWAQGITLDVAPILMSTDRAVNLGLILTELVINAGKYAYGGGAGPLSIAVEPQRNRFRLIVADHGRGKTGGRQGFGSRMLAAMVEQIGGVMEEADNGPGLRTIVTAPVQSE